MAVTSLIRTLVPLTGKIIKNGPSVFDRCNGVYSHMAVTSLVAALAPRTGKIIKNGLFGVFKRTEYLLQNSILHFVFRLSFAMTGHET